MIYTFWEGEMPDYISMCFDTWKGNFTILTYRDLESIGIDKDKLNPFSLPQIADIVRAHVLYHNGGVWLDADTIMLTGELPKENLLGYPDRRDATVGYLRTEAHSDFYREWVEYQDEMINRVNITKKVQWDEACYKFTDPYVKAHKEITIGDIENRWVETYMIKSNAERHLKYKQFYFKDKYKLSDIRPTDIIMLHNSWTPEWYRYASRTRILESDCTLSNIFKEILK